MIPPSLFYLNNLDLLSMKQRQQLVQYNQDVQSENDQIMFGY